MGSLLYIGIFYECILSSIIEISFKGFLSLFTLQPVTYFPTPYKYVTL